MLHCFQCGTDLPDNLLYCLQCGARLDDDEVPTVVEIPVVTADDKRPVPIEPKSGGMSKFLLGGLLGAGAVIVVLVLGTIFFNMRGTPRANTPVNKREVGNTPTSTPTSTPTPRKVSPTPTPLPANDDVPITQVRTCEIINPAGGAVNLRRNCDKLDCSKDDSTLYLQAEPGEPVDLKDAKPVTNGRFTWVQVVYQGETVWISSTRINCQ